MTFSSMDRDHILQDMCKEKFDVLVIGGGITGSGIALDAATRKMKTGLIEMQDFAAGTSSRSTKLVHGGLRYLKQFEVKLVAEVGKERAIVYENGPHVTKPEWMLLPIHKGGTFGKLSTTLGLRMYDFLAGVKKSERRSMLTTIETLNKEPLLRQEGLKGSGYYVEYRTDDARLTIEVLKEAVAQGTKAVNYTKVTELIYENQRIVGVVAKDQISNLMYKMYAKKVINATGPWVDTFREMDHSRSGKNLRLSKGVHIVIDQRKFPLKQAVYFDTPDGRMIFAIPRAGKTYVGTTDTFYEEDPINPWITSEDKNYLLAAIHYMFPTLKLVEGDIESSWAGVRPLIFEDGKDPSEISRKDEIWPSKSGLITIAGGKLTGYRKMAETVVNLVAKQLEDEDNLVFKSCSTKNLPISGGQVGGSQGFQEFINSYEERALEVGFSRAEYENLVQFYGSNIVKVMELAKGYQDDQHYGLPLDLYVQLVYSLKEEMTVKPVDYFIRRTGALYFNIDWVRKWSEAVIAFMADKCEWTTEQQNQYKEELNRQIQEATSTY
jgi:glycerol-3-phosphate dehydrogenase